MLQPCPPHTSHPTPSHQHTPAASLQLCCRLEPADIRLAPPSAEEFHADLQALFATGALPCGEESALLLLLTLPLDKSVAVLESRPGTLWLLRIRLFSQSDQASSGGWSRSTRLWPSITPYLSSATTRACATPLSSEWAGSAFRGRTIICSSVGYGQVCRSFAAMPAASQPAHYQPRPPMPRSCLSPSWEPVTETRRELIEVERPHYSADLANVQAYFAGMVQTTITNSGKRGSA